MIHETYLSSGFCHQPSLDKPLYGVADVALYNPGKADAELRMTAYFQKRAPYTLPQITVKAESCKLLEFPSVAPEIFNDCGFWGAKIESSAPILVNILSGYKKMLGQKLFTGGSTSFNATGLRNSWQFPDGLWLEWLKYYRNDEKLAPFPFNELEHYMFLNPHEEDLEAEIILQYSKRNYVTEKILLRAERIFVWENFEKVEYVSNYCLKIAAEKPLAASSVRYIYGLHGFNEWGIQVHCAMLPVPA